MKLAHKLPKSSASELARYYKNLAGLEAANTDEPQDGEAVIKLGRGNYCLTIVTSPVQDGEKVVITIEPENSPSSSLEELGLWGENLRALDHALAAPNGVILVGGQQRNFKLATTTTLMESFGPLANKLIFSEQKHHSLNASVNQTILRPELGLSLGHHLGLLDQPGFNVVAAEVKDSASASAVASLADKSDYLLLASVPAGSSVDSLYYWQRAVNNPTALTVARASLSQVFVRGLCASCRQSYYAGARERKFLDKNFGLGSASELKKVSELEQVAASRFEPKLALSASAGNITLWRADTAGCEYCDFTGYKSSIGLFEVCSLSEQLQSKLVAKASRQDLQSLAIK
jgi:type II secretory ATPase GspE/PulE/Tfp pilus assembly ATPase PilB-like protein